METFKIDSNTKAVAYKSSEDTTKVDITTQWTDEPIEGLPHTTTTTKVYKSLNMDYIKRKVRGQYAGAL